MYDALVITGTSGAGKTTVARSLAKMDLRLELVPAVTTRGRRDDDSSGQYEYIGRDEFEKLCGLETLLIETTYRDHRYGIRRTAVERVRKAGKTPLLVITPEAAKQIDVEDPFEDTEYRPFIVFIDAEDAVLDDRIAPRSTGVRHEILAQRQADRICASCAAYTLRTGIADDVRNLIVALWKSRDRSGVLPGLLIRRLVLCGTLLENASLGNVSGASYDLSLGDEYFYGGRIHRLSKRSPILTLAPYDYAIVTSNEVADFPRDVSGRFDLAVGLFCQGAILSNGPQVDPGFRGPLFCLLFNTSSSPIMLKRRQHYATIEFHKVLALTEGYKGPYQARTLLDYLPSNASQGAINELKKEVEQLRKEAQNLQATTWAILSLILAMIAVFVSFR